MTLRKVMTAAAALIALSGCASLQGPEPVRPGTVDPAQLTQTLKDFTDAGRLVGVSALVT